MITNKLKRIGKESYVKNIKPFLQGVAKNIVKTGLEKLEEEVLKKGSTKVDVSVRIVEDICRFHTEHLYKMVLKKTPIDISAKLGWDEISFTLAVPYSEYCGRKEYNKPTWVFKCNSCSVSLLHNLKHLKNIKNDSLRTKAFTKVLEFMQFEGEVVMKPSHRWDNHKTCTFGPCCKKDWTCEGCTKHPLKTPTDLGNIEALLRVLLPFSQKHPGVIVKLHQFGDPYTFYRAMRIPCSRTINYDIKIVKQDIIRHLEKLLSP